VIKLQIQFYEENIGEVLKVAEEKALYLKLFTMENKIKVVELFAGVGGFRLGLEGWNKNLHHQIIKKLLKVLTK
jgi:DNA (cytosine-5)-methyltransferase 1